MEQIFEDDNIELSIYNDGSSTSGFLLSDILERFLGMGYGKNRAVQYSSDRFLCFQNALLFLVGSKYERIPEGSTDRYTQMMMIKTQLLDLPNELFLYIFQYIKSSHLVQIFSEIKSFRIQALIQSFISHVDISQESEQWIQTYVPNLFNQQNLIALRLQDKYLANISQYLSSSDIQSMHVISSDWTTDILKEGLDHIQQHIKQLWITFTYPHGKGDIANQLFQSDSQYEYLNITGRFLYFDYDDINICTLLTYLSIELEGMHRVFALIEHLPNLQELKVKFRTEERLVQPKPNLDSVITHNKLYRVTFIGCTKYFDHLENFFSTFGSTIECLTINIDLMYYIIDGKRLENGLLNKMPCLSSLDIIIHSTAVYSNPLDIETFRSTTWQKFNPVIYWNDTHAHQKTIFTLPYKSDRFKHLSNDFISSWISNRSVSLCFEHVHTLSLITTTPLTLETFQFIEKTFLNLKTLELTDPIHLPEFEYENERLRNIPHLNDSFLLNRTVQLLSVTKFSFLARSQYDNYEIFHRFLHLLPNLIYLQMYIGRSLYREILTHEHDKNFIMNALIRIKLLQMVHFYDEKNILNNEEIHYLFPNAQILFDYDDI
ncbi:unnamed protein product [Adineta steineri]|uniref:F-box domain-containing protein n=1 Tax=Adineta steineri TaxID=433720 RepID=A0A814GAT0_9BILA|nr:unnamed protein product [Adineta steineri]